MGCVDLCDMFNFFVAHKYQDKTLVYQDASSLALIFQMSMPGICTNINVSILESRKYYNWLSSSLVLEIMKDLQELGILSKLLGDH